MQKRALVLYASITGNTEMIAKALGGVCEKYNFAVDYVKIKPKMDWEANPIDVMDYDLVFLGSPIIAGLPYKEVNNLMGLQGDCCLKGNPMKMKPTIQNPGIPGVVDPPRGMTPGVKGEVCKTVYGVAFVTYGGCTVGPAEAMPALSVLEEYFRVNGIRTIGKYACAGKELRHESVDTLGAMLKINIADAQALMQRYKDDPNSEEFKSMGAQQVALIKKLSSVKDEDSFGKGVRLMGTNDPLGCGMPGCSMWHYNFDLRPLPKDITRAEIFASDIIEDYFLTISGDPRTPYSVYLSIS